MSFDYPLELKTANREIFISRWQQKQATKPSRFRLKGEHIWGISTGLESHGNESRIVHGICWWRPDFSSSAIPKAESQPQQDCRHDDPDKTN